MGILGNIKVLSFLSCVLTSLRYQNGYYGCGGSHPYHYGRCAMLKLIFVAPKFRLRRVQKRGKKEQKMKNCVLQKNAVLGNTDRKIRVGKVCSSKLFFNFGNQLRCAILEISSYNTYFLNNLFSLTSL